MNGFFLQAHLRGPRREASHNYELNFGRTDNVGMGHGLQTGGSTPQRLIGVFGLTVFWRSDLAFEINGVTPIGGHQGQDCQHQGPTPHLRDFLGGS